MSRGAGIRREAPRGDLSRHARWSGSREDARDRRLTSISGADTGSLPGRVATDSAVAAILPSEPPRRLSAPEARQPPGAPREEGVHASDRGDRGGQVPRNIIVMIDVWAVSGMNFRQTRCRTVCHIFFTPRGTPRRGQRGGSPPRQLPPGENPRWRCQVRMHGCSFGERPGPVAAFWRCSNGLRDYLHVTSMPKKCRNTSRFGRFFGFCCALRM